MDLSAGNGMCGEYADMQMTKVNIHKHTTPTQNTNRHFSRLYDLHGTIHTSTHVTHTIWNIVALLPALAFLAIDNENNGCQCWNWSV